MRENKSLALRNFHSEAEYQSKKTNTSREENTVFSYILNTKSAWKGAGEGEERGGEGRETHTGGGSLTQEFKGGH